ncbi:MAG: carbohydrate ABC transporter permease [Anaerolineae bacterium]|nr:carbohydrate ABC transporter permease [Anaerolineae bacterium]MDW8170938.1 carbohydrate ABC transporter permease [Anaerolineae bacterium]
MITPKAKRQPSRTWHWLRRHILNEAQFTHVLLILLCLVVLFPIVYTLITSLRPQGFGLSREVVSFDTLFFGHYERLLSTPRFARQILNSAINSLSGAILTTLVTAMAGYAFARLDFPGRRAIFLFIIAMMLLPGITTLIPLYRIASDLGLLDTYFVVIMVYGAYGIPFGIWIMKGFYETIPRVLEEAAWVDGASPLQALFYVIIPMSLPGLTAVFLINFVFNWNDFLTALILLRSTEMRTATVGLFDFQNQLSGNNSELLAAASILIMTPGVVIFLIARKAFLRGMIEGAVKS